MLSVVSTLARTVESFPPEAPMAMVSPRWKRPVLLMVCRISDSKVDRKCVVQRGWPFLGRLILAGEGQ